MSDSNYHTFYYSILILSALFSVVLVKRLRSPYNWLAVLIILTSISEAIAKYISYSLHENNSIVYHVFTTVEFMFYIIIYQRFFKSKKWSLLLLAIFIFFLIAAILNILYLQPLNSANTNMSILESILLVFLSLSLFNRIRDYPVFDNIIKEGIFWFNSAVLIYYSFNVLVWGLHSIKVYQMAKPPYIIYYVNLVLSGLLYLVYSTSIYLHAKRKNLTALSL